MTIDICRTANEQIKQHGEDAGNGGVWAGVRDEGHSVHALFNGLPRYAIRSRAGS